MALFEMSLPSAMTLFTEDNIFTHAGPKSVAGDAWVDVEIVGETLRVCLTAGKTPVRFLRLRWVFPVPTSSLFLGDAWERTYGDAQWRSMDASRFMPWYFFLHDGDVTVAAGVKTGCGAMAAWTADPNGITLWLDVRCGGKGVLLEGRRMCAADILFKEYAEAPFAAARRFCRELCSTPLLPPAPVYGGNNWYYAYGKSSCEDILEDCRRIAELSGKCDNRPYMVIDDGWQTDRDESYNGGPWNRGNAAFPDMAELAHSMKCAGTRPGLWLRPLNLRRGGVPDSARSERQRVMLDPSHPEALARVREDIRRIVDWGYELIKHDFTTFDIFGRWGFEMRPFPAEGEWCFHDHARTSAEIVRGLYETILDASAGALILGCNTIGHLGAGVMHLARIGDDTSGHKWERTRAMGVNALAFRLPQHGTFFAIDADCLGITENIPWERNREWGRLLAGSGTPLFVSLHGKALTKELKNELGHLLYSASVQRDEAVPEDWLVNTCPEQWKISGKTSRFQWYEPEGSDPDFV